MTRVEFSSVSDYIAAQPETHKRILQHVRGAIRKGLPQAREVISYKIPAYQVHDVSVLYFAGWKQHYSLYPVSAPLLETFKDDLAPYKVSKGTIRFPLTEAVPVKLIERIAKFRAQEMEGARLKAAPPLGKSISARTFSPD